MDFCGAGGIYPFRVDCLLQKKGVEISLPVLSIVCSPVSRVLSRCVEYWHMRGLGHSHKRRRKLQGHHLVFNSTFPTWKYFTQSQI